MGKLSLEGSLYSLESEAEQGVIEQIQELENRVTVLRNSKTLTDKTLKDYYGEKRFEQVAESNAIEGSTLSIGETEAAILKGTTFTGHDPAYVKDAVALDKALTQVVKMAKDRKGWTTLTQLRKIHELVMGTQNDGGLFRKEPVSIRGSSHHPPKTLQEVDEGMKMWEQWSEKNRQLTVLARTVILHAWLTHIHPFRDGNGRTARAIMNLELVRGGYPPVIIRKKERQQYIAALEDSDSAGDIRSFFELVLGRAEDALQGLEISAKKQQGFDPIHEKIRMTQQRNLNVWDKSVSLLAETLANYLSKNLEKHGDVVEINPYESLLDVERYINLIDGKSVPFSWAFIVNITIPGVPKLERLVYIHKRHPDLYSHMGKIGGPTLYWSKKNPSGYPVWIPAGKDAPFCTEMTIKEGVGDSWIVRLHNEKITTLTTTKLAEQLADKLMKQIAQ